MATAQRPTKTIDSISELSDMCEHMAKCALWFEAEMIPQGWKWNQDVWLDVSEKESDAAGACLLAEGHEKTLSESDVYDSPNGLLHVIDHLRCGDLRGAWSLFYPGRPTEAQSAALKEADAFFVERLGSDEDSGARASEHLEWADYLDVAFRLRGADSVQEREERDDDA